MKVVLKNSDEAVVVLTKEEVQKLIGACCSAWLRYQRKDDVCVRGLMQKQLASLKDELKKLL